MSWWSATRRHRDLLVAVALVVLVAVLATWHTWTLPIPSLLAASAASVPLTVFAPLLVVAAVQRCLDGSVVAVEATAVRPVRLFDAAVTTAAVALAGVGSMVVGGDVGATIGRNVILFTGLGLATSVLLTNRAVTVVPLVVAGLAGPLGLRADGSAAAWAVPLHPSSSVAAWSVTFVAYPVGVSLFVGVGQSDGASLSRWSRRSASRPRASRRVETPSLT